MQDAFWSDGDDNDSEFPSDGRVGPDPDFEYAKLLKEVANAMDDLKLDVNLEGCPEECAADVSETKTRFGQTIIRSSGDESVLCAVGPRTFSIILRLDTATALLCRVDCRKYRSSPQ